MFFIVLDVWKHKWNWKSKYNSLYLVKSGFLGDFWAIFGIFLEKMSFELIPRYYKIPKSHITWLKISTDIKTHQHYHLRCLDIELTLCVKGFHQFLLVDTLADHTVSPLKPHTKKCASITNSICLFTAWMWQRWSSNRGKFINGMISSFYNYFVSGG